MHIELNELMRQKSRLNHINGELYATLKTVNSELKSVCSNIGSPELNQSCENITERLVYITNRMAVDLNAVEEFMGDQLKNYEVTNEEAQAALKDLVSSLNTSFDKNGAVMVCLDSGDEVVSTMTFSSAPPSGVDTSIYSNKPEKGFVVTTGNATYNLTDSEKQLLYNLVTCESDGTYDDSLAVISVVLNRCDDGPCVYSYGAGPMAQISAPNQFGTYYKGTVNPNCMTQEKMAIAKRAVDDALAGARNHQYISYRSNRSNYSTNLITPTGNQYDMLIRA